MLESLIKITQFSKPLVKIKFSLIIIAFFALFIFVISCVAIVFCASDELELFNIIKTLENNFNAKFVVSSSRNIYPYIANKKDIYKISNQKTKNIVNINSCIKQAIILNEYSKTNNNEDFNSFFEENEYLINEEDINYFNNNVLPSLNYQIGLIYCNNKLEIKSIDDSENSIVKIKNNLEKIFLEIIYKYLTDSIDSD